MGGVMLLMIAGIAGKLWVTRSLWDTTIKVTWWFSPFNWKGWLLMLGLFAPGAVCLWSSSKLGGPDDYTGP